MSWESVLRTLVSIYMNFVALTGLQIREAKRSEWILTHGGWWCNAFRPLEISVLSPIRQRKRRTSV